MRPSAWVSSIADAMGAGRLRRLPHLPFVSYNLCAQARGFSPLLMQGRWDKCLLACQDLNETLSMSTNPQEAEVFRRVLTAEEIILLARFFPPLHFVILLSLTMKHHNDHV
jgi:hypothetical protein